MEKETVELNVSVEQSTQSSSRKLASVQVIEDIKEHTNADKLSLAKVLGWQVVIKKEELKIGQKVVYFEIDSLLPDRPWSEFMKDKKFRVKTIQLRKEISQGLILPLSILGENVNEDDFQIGQDLSDIIGVTKYENDADLPDTTSDKNKIPFPSEWIEKSDEPRIQSTPKLLANFEGNPYIATLKYDGTSSTYLVNPNDTEDFIICSRNLRRLYSKDEVYSQIADTYKIKEKLINEQCRYAIQGEIYGPKISKNYLQVKEKKFVVFNARDLKEGRYLDFDELESLCKKLQLPIVEVVERGDCFKYTVDDLKSVVKGNYPNTKSPREGLVFRLARKWYQFRERNSFKIINDDFLIKHEGK